MLVAAISLAAFAAAAALVAFARRRAATWRQALAAGVVLLVGLVSAGLGIAHLVAVIAVGVERPGPLAYDFRFASLLLVGLLLAAGGAVCAAAAAPRLSRGRALAGTFVLLLVNVPLIPIQGFAVALAIAALVNLVAVHVGRR